MIGERIKDVREKARGEKLTQTKFGEVLGVSRDVIANLETGRVEPSQVIMNAICMNFNVDEIWLRTGEGEMFAPVRDDQVISRFLGDLVKEPESSFKRRLISTLSQLDETEWTTLEKIFDKIANNKSVAGQNCPGKGGPAV